jgi:5'-nucleotidase
MEKRMRILVSNDDGIFSPGLKALAEVASKFGNVRVVAPDVEQSAMSHAVTIQRPLQYHATELNGFEAYRVNGTPADCVALGLYHWEGADLVLSGINIGSNLGHEIWHSGTVAAAKQAALLNVPAIAFSLALDGKDPDFDPLGSYIEEVIALLLECDCPMLVNVNLPPSPRGIRWTHQSVRAYKGNVVEGQDPFGRKHYWFAPLPYTDPEEGSDRWAVEKGLVALTPLSLDVTDKESLKHQREVQLESLSAN